MKVIAPQSCARRVVERFKREAKAAGRLHHPNVVNVTDFGFARVGPDRVAYLVMEFLDGCTLAEVLEEESQLAITWVVDIIEQACSAVDAAHRHGIIHRDLKPDNIWLEPNRRGGYGSRCWTLVLLSSAIRLQLKSEASQSGGARSLTRRFLATGSLATFDTRVKRASKDSLIEPSTHTHAGSRSSRANVNRRLAAEAQTLIRGCRRHLSD